MSTDVIRLYRLFRPHVGTFSHSRTKASKSELALIEVILKMTSFSKIVTHCTANFSPHKGALQIRSLTLLAMNLIPMHVRNIPLFAIMHSSLAGLEIMDYSSNPSTI
jgi:hypothetical protein